MANYIDIYQHYRPEEEGFIDTVLGWLQWVENRFSAYLSPFLTPRQAMIVSQLVGTNEDVKVAFWGGCEGAERKRALIYPQYYEVNEASFEIQAININFPLKFGQLTHGRILGTFTSTGVDRDRTGDIITDGTSWHVIVDASMTEFYMSNITKIANVGVHLEPIASDEIIQSDESWESVFLVASSLRLDTLLSKVYNFSRQRAKNAIAGGQVKVNFIEMTRPDVVIGVEDIVSLRHYGRFWIKQVQGMTKKDNYKLQVNVLEH